MLAATHEFLLIYSNSLHICKCWSQSPNQYTINCSSTAIKINRTYCLEGCNYPLLFFVGNRILDVEICLFVDGIYNVPNTEEKFTVRYAISCHNVIWRTSMEILEGAGQSDGCINFPTCRRWRIFIVSCSTCLTVSSASFPFGDFCSLIKFYFDAIFQLIA